MKENCCIEFLILLCRYVLGPLFALPFMTLLTPIFAIWDGWVFSWWQSRFISNPIEHRNKVARVQNQVRAWNANGRRAKMCTARPAWATPTVHNLDKRALCQIQLNELNCVVQIDEVNRLVTVEPSMMLGQLTSILIPRGWTIPCVPELEALTVGGVVCGAGVESSSGLYGMSGDCAVEFEVVVSSGEVVNCSKDKNSDLFYTIPWSHGTLGFLTAVKFPLLPAKKYVQLEYHVPDTDAEIQILLEDQQHLFVEGISFGRHLFVITLGKMVDHVDRSQGSVNHINWWYKPFFWQHCKSMLGRRRSKARQERGKTGGKGSNLRPVYVDHILLRDYYHRHTRGSFWVMQILLPPFCTRLARLLFGWSFHLVDARVPQAMLLSPLESSPALWRLVHIAQDFVIPMKYLLKSIDFLEEVSGVQPLWFCPCKVFKRPGMMSCKGDEDKESELFIDIGIWGLVSKKARPKFHPVETLRELEAFTIEHDGYQGTYADMLLSREQFRHMFNHNLYDEVRSKYNCLDAYPDLYDKIGKEARRIEYNV